LGVSVTRARKRYLTHGFGIRCPSVASAPRGNSLGDMGSAEVLLRQHAIMEGAEQAEILRCRAAASAFAHVAATQAVAYCDLAPHCVRNVLAV
jgi:hypothetical protein